MEDIRSSSKDLHPEVQSISREDVQESLKNPKGTLPYYYKYEQVTAIATRAQQLAEGARPLVSIEGMVTSAPDFVWKVAEKELQEKRLPFILHRRIPNGKSEYWSTNELNVMW
jgi:DNA-directed RNA polymerase subunit K/omega